MTFFQWSLTYIKKTTSADATILLWGAETSINFFTKRRSPSRFVYQYPLYNHNYVDEQMIEEFLGDIIQNKPLLIIDTGNPATPMYDFPIKNKTIQSNIAYLKTHYHSKGSFGDWTVYEYLRE